MQKFQRWLITNGRNVKSPSRHYVPDLALEVHSPTVPAVPSICTPAAQEVLATSELLHLIFSYLSPSTLVLSAKRVCRTWYSVISNPSPSLEVSLFLRPAPEHSPLFITPTTNDILTQAFPFWLLNTRKLPRPGVCTCRPNKCGPWTTAGSVSLLRWKLNPAAWQRNTSWRKVLLVQPPCRKLAFWKETTHFYINEPHRSNRTRFVIDCPGGVTLGILYDIVEGWVREAKDEEYMSEYKESLVRIGNGPDDFEDVRDRGDWSRKELYLCDTLTERSHLLFLHLDIDRHALAYV